MLVTSQKVVVQKGWCAAARWCFCTCVEINTTCACIVLLCQYDFVSEVNSVVDLTACTRSCGVLVINPGTESALCDSGVKDARGVEVYILGIAVQTKGIAQFPHAIGNAVGTWRENIFRG